MTGFSFHVLRLRDVGGQHTRSSVGVLCLDEATGIAVYVDSERSQRSNRDAAELCLLELLERLR